MYIINRFLTLIWKILSAFVATLLISCLPYLFDDFQLNMTNYFGHIIDLLQKVVLLGEFQYATGGDTFRPLFPTIFEALRQSLQLIVGSLLISGFVSIIIAIFVVNLKEKYIKIIQEILTYIQSIPDLFYIIGLQLFIVWLYKKTDIVFLNFASYGEEQAIFLPILCLSITPTMIITKLLINQMIEELHKNYAHLAKAKGVSSFNIIFVHILRNTVYSLFHYSKTIILFFLTNLLIVEYLFNIPGVMSFLLNYPFPDVFFISLLLLYYPIFLLFQLYELFVPSVIKKGEA
ncbi:ABC transporter permease subunit [Bacillus spongiae]|uniref:ABC transporter permease subunit n=1 Tax=Bacillus spongiae TaxID=2683610 RepID=A0ABU8HHL1_9BACI